MTPYWAAEEWNLTSKRQKGESWARKVDLKIKRLHDVQAAAPRLFFVRTSRTMVSDLQFATEQQLAASPFSIRTSRTKSAPHKVYASAEAGLTPSSIQGYHRPPLMGQQYSCCEFAVIPSLCGVKVPRICAW